MAHELDLNKETGYSTMGRRIGSAKAWHETDTFRPGLFKQSDPLRVWAEQSSFDFDVVKSALTANVYGERVKLHDYVAIHRVNIDGSVSLLSVQKKNYKPVQPIEILSFFKNQADRAGMILDTAGVLQGGKRYWASAIDGTELDLGNDRVVRNLILVTSTDGTLSTQCFWSTVRVVCNNTLRLALSGRSEHYRQTHKGYFDPDKAAIDVGIGQANTAWSTFSEQCKQLVDLAVTQDQVEAYLDAIFGEDSKHSGICASLFNGCGIGAELETSKGSAWGLLNAVTEYVDHVQPARSDRQNKAWFGTGNTVKNKAFELILELL